MREGALALLRLAAVALAAPVVVAQAATAQQLLGGYAAQAAREMPAFTQFSAARGAEFYRAERPRADGVKAGCAGCHTADPRASGRTRANKDIAPLAPVANPQRFTDPAQVEKWFGRNCKDVLERDCTAQEKGDFIAYLLSVR